MHVLPALCGWSALTSSLPLALTLQECLQFGNESPQSSEGGEADGREDNNGIMKQIRQLQDLKRMVIQNQSDGVPFHAGCTAVVAFKHNNMLYVANAGDSRGVLCREGMLAITTCGAK